MWNLLFACTTPAETDVQDTEIPATRLVGEATVAVADEHAPLSAELTLHFSRPVAVSVDLDDGAHPFSVTSALAQDHVIPLVALYANATWNLVIHATDEVGDPVDVPPVSYVTPALPEPFPHVELRANDPDRASGWTLMAVQSMRNASYIVAFDENAEVAWLYDRALQPMSVVSVMANGHVLILTDSQALEVDWLGRQQALFSSSGAAAGIPLEGIEQLNHELFYSSAGTYISLDQERITVDDFPVSYEDPTLRVESQVALQNVVEFDASGQVIDRWPVTEFTPLTRIGYDSLQPTAWGADWSHANAVVEDPTRDAWLVSIRHHDAVFSLERDSHAIRWILGHHDNWPAEYAPYLLEPVGEPFAWPYHQHSPKITPDGRVLLMDNGNYGAAPWTGHPTCTADQCHSRVVEYQVDEDERTVRQLWEWEPTPSLFSGAMGDATRLENGHILATFAFVYFEDEQPNHVIGRGLPSIRAIEFDPTDGRTVWDLDLWADRDASAPNWQSFRAVHIAIPR